ncbi:MAG: hypothetical protein ACOCVI_02270 [Planctomycetota bacterium]
MLDRVAVCPSCQTKLVIPPGCSDCHVRCGQCRCRFRLPKIVPVTDDRIASWLWDEQPGEDYAESADGDEAGYQSAEESLEEQLDRAVRETPSSGDTMVVPAISQHEGDVGMRIVKFSSREAVLEFPARRLEDPRFRCAMPRQCLRCGQRNHLRAHVIIFTPELRDSFSIEEEHQAGGMVLSNTEVRGLTGEQILSRLPKVPNIPPPGNLPMPYWVCDMCTAVGMIGGQINVNPETRKGTCRLRIRSLRAAEQFMVAAGAGESEDHDAIKAKLDAQEENPWDDLPETVQHRVKQWYKPHDSERFVAYVADRDRARTEDGMAGILITTDRLIYHQAYRHDESSIHEAAELTLAMAGPKGDLSLRTPGWQVKRMRVDRDGVKTLRRGLFKSSAKAHWK